TGQYVDIGRLDKHDLTIDWDDDNDTANATFDIPAIHDADGNAILLVGDLISSSTDDSVLLITAVNAVNGQVSFSVQHQYLDDGLADGVNGANGTASDTSTIEVTVADDDTGVSATVSENVLVSNVVPVVTLNDVTGINENSVAVLTGQYVD